MTLLSRSALRARTLGKLLGFVATALVLPAACSEDSLPARPSASGGSGAGSNVQTGPCSDGKTRECGVTLGRHGNVVTCFKGTQSCTRGTWGVCGDGKVTQEVRPPAAGFSVQALGPPSPCLDNPCDPYCRNFDEQPAGGLVSDAGVPTLVWDAGSLNDLPNGVVNKAFKQPCKTGADCQFNHQCSDVATGTACLHGKCELGNVLQASCDPCVQAICAVDPVCCGGTTCAHEVCSPGIKLDAGCDACVASVCALNPTCCSGTWDDTCVSLVAQACGANTCSCAADEILGPGGSCYHLYTANDDWVAARDRCRSRGSGWDLVTIDSAAENDFVKSTVVSSIGTWIGLNDRDPSPEGAFAWSGGQPVSYTSWDAGEPNNYNNEDCTQIFTSGGWNDAVCSADHDHLCEGPAQPTPRQWTQSCIDKVTTVCNAKCGAGAAPAGSGTCAPWLPGQTDPACTGVPDLAVGVPCSGGRVPVCNHGTVAAAAGVELAFFPPAAAQYPSCTPDPAQARGTCSTSTPIPPGECVTIACNGLADADEIVVNPPGPRHVSECACSNNWAVYSASAGCGAPICSGASSQGFSKQLNVYIVLDESGSMGSGNKWLGATTALKALLSDSNATGFGVALEIFPLPAAAGAQGCGEDSCTAAECAAPLVPLGVLQASAAPTDAHEALLVSTLDGQAPGGNSPILPALSGGLDWANANAAPTSANVVLFVSDGEPATTCLSGDANATQTALLQRVEAAFVNNGVRTFALGVEGANMAALHELASVGGSGQAFELDGTNETLVAAELLSALQSVARRAVSCSFDLPNTGNFNPNDARVTFTSASGAQTTLPRRSGASACADGWYFDDYADPRVVTLCPASCAAAQADSAPRVDIEIGCPVTLNTTTRTERYSGECPPGTSSQWSFFTYNTTTPRDSSIHFRARTAPTVAELSTAPFVDLATARATPNTQVCGLGGPAPCPIDLFNLLGPVNAKVRELELEAVFSPTSNQRLSPILNNWKITYSCPPAE